MTELAIVVAMTSNRVIGQGNTLPWHLPEDLKHFRQLTMGKAIIMGRLTYESIGRPLPGRHNIVISRRDGWSDEGIHVVANIESALEAAKKYSKEQGQTQVMIIGGGQIYQQILDRVDVIYLTEIDTEIDGDAFFPEFDLSNWQEMKRDVRKIDERNAYDYAFVELRRLSK